MYSGAIKALEINMSNQNKEFFSLYKKTLNIFELIITGNNKEFLQLDNLSILSVFNESLSKNENIYERLITKNNIFFKNDSFKDNVLKIIGNYLDLKDNYRYNRETALIKLEERCLRLYNFEFYLLKFNLNLIENIYHCPEVKILDQLNLLEDIAQTHITKYFDIIKISGNSTPKLGRSFYSKDGVVLRFCLKGEMRFENVSKVLCKNNFIMTRKKFLGIYQILTDDIEYILIHIKENFFEDFYTKIIEKSFFLHKHFKFSPDCLEILDSFKDINQINLVLFRLFSRIFMEYSEHKSFDKNENIIEEIVKYVNENITTITVADIQKKFFLNKNNVVSLFLEEFQMYPSQYILDQKLQLAAYDLITQKNKISDISENLNFSNSGFLSKVFKEKYNKTPLEFRKIKQKEIKNLES